MGERYFVVSIGDVTLLGCQECGALVFDQDQHEQWHDSKTTGVLKT